MLDRTLQASGHSVTFLYATQQQEPLCLQLQGGIAHLCLEPWTTGHTDTAARTYAPPCGCTYMLAALLPSISARRTAQLRIDLAFIVSGATFHMAHGVLVRVSSRKGRALF